MTLVFSLCHSSCNVDTGRSLLQATKEATSEVCFITALGARFRMPTFNNRVLLLTAGALLATSACGGNTAVPSGVAGSNSGSQVSSASRASAGGSSVVPNDTTSILKKLTKDVEIGFDSRSEKMADMGPHAISLVHSTFGLKKGQLLACNFEDSAGHCRQRHDD